MSKNFIEISDSEKLVLFEFLNRIINDKYDELSGDLFEDISEEHILSTIHCQLEKTMTEPLNPDYKELLLKAREDVRNHYHKKTWENSSQAYITHKYSRDYSLLARLIPNLSY